MFINDNVRVKRQTAQRGFQMVAGDATEHNVFSTCVFFSMCWGIMIILIFYKSFSLVDLGMQRETGGSALMPHKGEEALLISL